MIPRKLIMIGVVKVALLLAATAVVFSMYGCNTMRGLGEDIEKAGEGIQKSSK